MKTTQPTVTRISDLQAKDVVNVSDGCILGQVQDVELQIPSGQVVALVVPGDMRWFGLRQGGPVRIIPWRQIERIGSDVILVRVQVEQERGEFQDKLPPPYEPAKTL